MTLASGDCIEWNPEHPVHGGHGQRLLHEASHLTKESMSIKTIHVPTPKEGAETFELSFSIQGPSGKGVSQPWMRSMGGLTADEANFIGNGFKEVVERMYEKFRKGKG